MFLRAWRAVLEDRTLEVRATLDLLAEAYPLDKEALYLAGNHRLIMDSDATGLDLIQRALQLDPSFYLAKIDFLQAMSGFGWGDRHVGQIRTILASSNRMEEFFHGGLGFLASGFDEEGTAALRRYSQLRGGRWPNNFIIRHLVRVGRAGEAESLARTALTLDEPLSPSWRGHYISLVEVLTAQGRIAAAAATVEEEERLASSQAAKEGRTLVPIDWRFRVAPWWLPGHPHRSSPRWENRGPRRGMAIRGRPSG